MPDFWWALTGSNRRHSACKADALPAELSARMVTGGESNPDTAVKGRCLNRLTNRPVGSPSRTRTYNNSVNSRVLYRLSYRGRSLTFLNVTSGIIWQFCNLVNTFLKFLLIFMFNLNNYFCTSCIPFLVLQPGRCNSHGKNTAKSPVCKTT